MSNHCPDCGATLEDFVEGSSMRQRCPSCGWSLATTYAPPILEDDAEYTITLLAGNDASLALSCASVYRDVMTVGLMPSYLGVDNGEQRHERPPRTRLLAQVVEHEHLARGVPLERPLARPSHIERLPDGFPAKNERPAPRALLSACGLDYEAPRDEVPEGPSGLPLRHVQELGAALGRLGVGAGLLLAEAEDPRVDEEVRSPESQPCRHKAVHRSELAASSADIMSKLLPISRRLI